MKDNKKITEKTKKKNKKCIIKKKNTMGIIVTSIIIALAIAAVIGIIFLIRYIVINCKYSYYTEKMDWYGYNKLYDNQNAKSAQSVNSDEIVKMVTGVLYNSVEPNFAKNSLFTEDKDKLSTNEAWVEFAKGVSLIKSEDGINEGKITKLQTAKMLVRGIENLYATKIEITKSLNANDRKDYGEKELELIDKAISIGILEDSKSDLEKTNLVKGELNKMLITIAEKYATVYYKNGRFAGINGLLVTDKDKLPKNASIYPYIVDTIPKEIYEIEMPEMLTQISVSPKNVYDIYYEEYGNTDRNVTNYFNTILNIDYKTIDADSFIQQLNPYMAYNLEQMISDKRLYRESVEEYVAYVKENEIVLSGKATPLLPIIYSNGLMHFVRCKIEFKVLDSKTNENLLLWDDGVTYNSNDISVYTDVVVTPSAYSKAFRIYNAISCMNLMVRDENNLVTVQQN